MKAQTHLSMVPWAFSAVVRGIVCCSLEFTPLPPTNRVLHHLFSGLQSGGLKYFAGAVAVNMHTTHTSHIQNHLALDWSGKGLDSPRIRIFVSYATA
jgi:hypothetical protein